MAFKLLLSLSLGVAILSADGNNEKPKREKQVHEHWDYQDTGNWIKSYPDCGAQDESPINIVTETAVIDEDECVAQFDWNIEDHHMFRVINNGHSLQLVKFVIQ